MYVSGLLMSELFVGGIEGGIEEGRQGGRQRREGERESQRKLGGHTDKLMNGKTDTWKDG